MCNSSSNGTSLKIMSRASIKVLGPFQDVQHLKLVLWWGNRGVIHWLLTAGTKPEYLHRCIPSSMPLQPPPSPSDVSGWRHSPNSASSPTSPAVLPAGTDGLPPALAFLEFLTSYSHPVDTHWFFSAAVKANSKINIMQVSQWPQV